MITATSFICSRNRTFAHNTVELVGNTGSSLPIYPAEKRPVRQVSESEGSGGNRDREKQPSKQGESRGFWIFQN